MTDVLIVDDSLTVRMDLDERFSAAGFHTILCKNGAEARQALTTGAPGLILLDVILPDANGVELLEEFRSTPATADVPIIMLSAEAEIADRLRGLTSGADEYVGKPYNGEHLMACARQLVQESQRIPEPNTPLILIVDDSASVRHKLENVLLDEGYRVAAAENGEEGLVMASELRPDAIVVDSIMTGIGGTTFIQRLRLNSALHKTPCLLLTASRKRSYELEALDSGADAYLHKSDGSDIFLVRLAALLRSRQVEPIIRGDDELRGTQTILAVDDSRTYREKLREELLSDGYEVVTAGSGKAALEVLGDRQIDCILLDLMMPGMTGIELCHHLKKSSDWRHIPLIMLTAREEREAMIQGINAGADDYVTKTANFDLLRARLRAQLRRKHYERENRRIRDELLRMELEARAARDVADAKAALLDRVEEQNHQLGQANRELERAKREAEEESRFKSKFLANMSHELRTPLNAIIGFSELLMREIPGPLEPTQREYVGSVLDSGKHLLDLINDVLDLSKIEAGRMELQREPINLEIILDAIQGIGQPLAGKKSIDLQFIVEGPLPQVSADPVRLKQILYNLLSNAIKFTESGGEVRVAARAEPEAAVLSVQDTGVGISKKDQARLFREFEQLESGRLVTDQAGTGLGLALVRRLVDLHGGRVTVDSDSGVGSTFTVYLPLEPDLANHFHSPPSKGEAL